MLKLIEIDGHPFLSVPVFLYKYRCMLCRNKCDARIRSITMADATKHAYYCCTHCLGDQDGYLTSNIDFGELHVVIEELE